MKQHQKLILASASPRRKELLGNMGLEFTIQPSDIAEVGFEGVPEEIPSRIVIEKMKAAKSSYHLVAPLARRSLFSGIVLTTTDGEDGSGYVGQNPYFLAADTIVALDQDVYGKPENQEHARSMLATLSGKTHQVYTCFRIENFEGDYIEKTIRTDVQMRTISKEMLQWYLDTKEPFDKAGGYAIQGFGSVLVESIQGSYTNVVGLPLAEVVDGLAELKVISF